MVQQNTNSASVSYTVQLNKVELGLFGGEVTLLLVVSWLVAKLPGGKMTGNPRYVGAADADLWRGGIFFKVFCRTQSKHSKASSES